MISYQYTFVAIQQKMLLSYGDLYVASERHKIYHKWLEKFAEKKPIKIISEVIITTYVQLQHFEIQIF
jgi:hypothetical protein